MERHRREVSGQAIEAADPGPDATAGLEAADNRRFVQTILNDMKLDRRVVFIMHELNGHSVREIAGALGIPLATVYTRLRLATLEFGRRARRSRLPKLAGGAA